MKFKELVYNQLLTIRYVLGHTKKYHEGKKKSKLQILSDLLAWQIREGEFNSMYYAVGIEQKAIAQSNYIGRKTFLKIKTKVEKRLKTRAGSERIIYDVITKDKFYANSILKANAMPCILNTALISGYSLIFPDGKNKELEYIFDFKEPFFIKNITLEAGEGILFCKACKEAIEVNGKSISFDEFKNLLGDKIWVIQDQYHSHEVLKKINATALNTTRIVTIFNGKFPEYLCGFQGFATGDTVTDSWSHGSVYVGINVENESLVGFGLTSPSDNREGLLSSHPDSGIIFDGYPLPFLKDAVDLCIKAHRLFYFNYIIGWDVAITDNGPLIVEANEKPGMNVAQALGGGLREKVLSYALKILND